ncbi:MAG TPA: hypothetical protein VHA15_05725 [Burkholderiales bacterium]|nr:hypothetical protein [Burkholderiales bacterium]
MKAKKAKPKKPVQPAPKKEKAPEGNRERFDQLLDDAVLGVRKK